MKFKLALLCLILHGLNFVYSECPDSFFDCKNGKCIAHFFKCDDDNDCGNFEDEINCIGNGSNSSQTFQPHKPCPSDHFSCEDEFHTCIPNRWICDGMQECSNGKDELNCTSDKVDCGEDFKCANLQCVPSIWRCDGVSDCDDNSDELNCTSFKKKLLCDKQHGKYQCSSGECIDYSKTCDKKKDCLLGDDEGTLCHANACHDKKCSHLCLIDPKTNSSACYCPPGFVLRNNTCSDYDECSDNKLTNLCSQKCLNLEGSFKCECFDDYELIGNNSCQVKNGSPILYFSIGNEIRAFDLRNKTYYPIVETQHAEIIIGMDLIIKDKKLFYFSSEVESHGSVYQLNIEDNKQLQSNEQLLFHEDIKGIEGMSIDWLAGHFYLTESSKNKIIACDISSTLCTTLLENLSSPRGILVLPLKGKLFWTQWGKQAAIFQSLMDGTEKSVLVDNVEWPNDLTMDTMMNRLYWCDGKDGLIEYYDFDTKVRHVVLKDPKRQPYSLFVFEDNLYWTDWTTNQIEVCDKITGHHVKPLLMDASHRFFGLTIYHPILQSSSSHKPYNPCLLHGCSHLCLIKTPTSYSCKCPDHMVLSENKKTCREKTDEPYLLVNTGFQIFKYYINSITNSHSEKLAIFENFKISEFALNYNRNELYIYDTYKNRIGVLNLNIQGPQQWKTLVRNDLQAIMGLVYDVNTENLYWVDMLKGTLEVATINGKSRANIVSGLEKPISLAINAHTKKLYVGLRSNPSRIISMNMDGSSSRTLLVSQGGLPLAIATKPNDNELIWGDPIYQKIDIISIKDQMPKSQPQKMIEKDVKTVNSVAILNETIYWTNVDSPMVYYSRLTTIDNKRVIYRKHIISNNIDIDLLKVIVGFKEHPVDVSCQKGHHKCSHICLLSRSGHTCKCSKGYILSRDGFTCTKSKQQEATNTGAKAFLNIQRFFDIIYSKQNDNGQEDTWMLKFDTKPTDSSKSTPIIKNNATVTPTPKQTTDNGLHKYKPDTDKVHRAEPLTFSKIITRGLIIMMLLFTAYLIYLVFADRKSLVRFGQQVRIVRPRRDDKPIRFFANPNYNPGFITTDCQPIVKNSEQLSGI